ncbi:modifier of mdg4-like isoform X4 [Anopheles sinensis]|uniref:Modifier of mdg4-like isoform X4 n=1 Tax=Anopheles sinensis TaxID=74873 RepID=A0A084WSS6_ANOSI|nr:modifier of mdg4-like isoform X4 [Anopheles sinensis]
MHTVRTDLLQSSSNHPKLAQPKLTPISNLLISSCTKYKCYARVILSNSQKIRSVGRHTHGPETERIEYGRQKRGFPVEETTDHKDDTPTVVCPPDIKQHYVIPD